MSQNPKTISRTCSNHGSSESSASSAPFFEGGLFGIPKMDEALRKSCFQELFRVIQNSPSRKSIQGGKFWMVRWDQKIISLENHHLYWEDQVDVTAMWLMKPEGFHIHEIPWKSSIFLWFSYGFPMVSSHVWWYSIPSSSNPLWTWTRPAPCAASMARARRRKGLRCCFSAMLGGQGGSLHPIPRGWGLRRLSLESDGDFRGYGIIHGVYDVLKWDSMWTCLGYKGEIKPTR